jgi:hypothetical protein
MVIVTIELWNGGMTKNVVFCHEKNHQEPVCDDQDWRAIHYTSHAVLVCPSPERNCTQEEEKDSQKLTLSRVSLDKDEYRH